MATRYENAYRNLLMQVLVQGSVRASRVGPTLQLFGSVIPIIDLTRDEFPILTTRRMYMGGILGELAAFLKGATTLREFKDFGCHYWDDNAAKWEGNRGHVPEDYLVGNVYGAQWRKFGKHGVDQIEMLQEGLLKDPYGRRHLLTTLDPSTFHEACLPPCHLLTQFNVTNEGALDAIVYMRSVDLCLGLPADVALYAVLLCLTAQSVNLKPGRLAFMMGDSHIYHVHNDQARVQLEREVLDPAHYKLNPKATLDSFAPSDFTITDYNFHEPIKYELLT